DDSLFLFTKNWLDSRSMLYALPAVPGDQMAVSRDTLDTQGLVTGATYDPITGAVALVGYTNTVFIPFVWQLSGYPGHNFFDGTAVRHALSLAFVQMEAIAWRGPGAVFLSNEQSPFSAARLWNLELDIITVTPEPLHAPVHAFPIPTTGPLYLDNVPEGATAQLFDLAGRPVATALLMQREFDLSQVPDGLYQLVIQASGRVERVTVIVAR
ncbi:MAG: T9SS type A sorting domain-containing protein, partial [Flavobacteriales bacterium]